VGYSLATVNVSVDFSANPDKVQALLAQVALDVRNMPEFKDLFVGEPQVLGVDSVKGSQLIFPVQFKTLPTKQYGPMREFQRRVRLALEEQHMLPGDPLRVYGAQTGGAAQKRPHPEAEPAAPEPVDPTTIKPQETNPFTGE
jgi:small conductance mechanosensitive channel